MAETDREAKALKAYVAALAEMDEAEKVYKDKKAAAEKAWKEYQAIQNEGVWD